MTHSRSLFAALIAGTLFLAACTSTEANPERASGDVAFTGCDEVACTGEIGGADYEILLPDAWNGTLLIWSHGYRQPQPAPPDFNPVSTSAEPAPGGSDGEVADALLSEGYALAGSAYVSNGWAVADGVTAGEDLYDFFVENIGSPQRTIAWGESLGGLVTQVLAERNSDWVSGVIPTCGALAGPNDNLDLGMDVGYAVKTLLAPELELSGYDSWDDAVANWEYAQQQVLAATQDLTTGVPNLLVVGALADAPTQTKDFDGSTVESQIGGLVESLLTALGFTTYVRSEIEERFGGNPSQNVDADYGARVDEGERTLIEGVAPGALDAALEALAAGERVAADPAAREAFSAAGDTTGAVQDPTITIHTAADPLVLAQNETQFVTRAFANEDRTADVLPFFTVAPDSYPPSSDGGGGAPYGAGHCNFTAETYTGLVDVMQGWVTTGAIPAPSAVEDAIGSDSGLSLGYSAGPWPSMEARAEN